MSFEFPERITNPSVYLKSLSEGQRALIQEDVEKRALAYLLSRKPHETLVVDAMCGDLDFNPAQRQLLNSLLRRLHKNGFGVLVVGRKGHSTKFQNWPSGFLLYLDTRARSHLSNRPTAKESIEAVTIELRRTATLLSSIVSGNPVW